MTDLNDIEVGDWRSYAVPVPVLVLKREAYLVLVQFPDGSQEWVDCAYLGGRQQTMEHGDKLSQMAREGKIELRPTPMLSFTFDKEKPND